ncbi:MAG TPA: DUF2955 domain-containing protein [Steroidobacteraceae bacterium]|nr:DUF2955 domain-containing protein [Steroidobacteraceae bacterium]
MMDVRSHAVMRFAFGVTFAFVVAELAEWTPTFLPPVLVAVLLTNIPIRPPPKVAMGFIILVAASSLLAVLLCAALRGAPVILFAITVLVVFRALYALARGAPMLGPLMLMICITAIPVVALQSTYIAGQFAYALARAALVAVLIVWLVYLFWPKFAPPKAAPKAAALPPAFAMRSALLGTAIMAPLMLAYLTFGFAEALPVLIATVMIVASLDLNRGRKQALGLVIANIAGGIASLALILMLVLNPSLATFTLVMLAGSLIAGWRITRGDPMAALVVVAFNACLIVFSSSIGADSGTFSIWLTRLTHFLIAGAFAVGMMALLWPRDAQQTTTLEINK